MKILKHLFRFVVIGVVSILSTSKSKAASKTPMGAIDKRITEVRKNINNQLKDKAASDINVEFKNFTTNNDWANWGNWGNWNNWNNWAKWDNWNNWAKWNDFSNWQKFSNY